MKNKETIELTKAEFEEMYIVEGPDRLAARLGISKTQIYNLLDKHNIPRKGRKKKVIIK